MAAVFGTLTTSAPQATGTALKTILQLVAPANQRLRINSIKVGFKGTSPTDQPIRVQLTKQTTAGTMTARSPVKVDGGSTTLQSTGQENATAEPTAGSTVYDNALHPQNTLVENLIGQNIILEGGERLGLVVTAVTATVNCDATISFEE